MFKRRFQIKSDLTIEKAIEVICKLFDERSIRYQKSASTIITTSIILPLFSFSKRWFSRDNWMGINPFLYFDRIEVIFSPSNKSKTSLDINISSWRFKCISILSLIGAVILGAFKILEGVLLLTLFSAVIFLFAILLPKYLAPREIKRALEEAL